MTEENQLPSELETLKSRADLMGITYHPSIGIETLKARINEAMGEEPPKSSKLPEDVTAMTHAEYQKRMGINRKKEASRLVRVQVTCMNPDKKDWEGEIISVGSAKMGTFKKYVLFNAIPYHIPHIIYEYIKDRKYTTFYTVKDHLGNKVRKGKLVNEFSINVLPPLTKQELKDLAKQQAMAGSIDRSE